MKYLLPSKELRITKALGYITNPNLSNANIGLNYF